MRKTKVYISKSNQYNPDHIMTIRQTLLQMGVEIVEFQGGQYSDAPLIASDFVLVITAGLAPFVGKGQFSQVKVAQSYPERFKDRIFAVTSFPQGQPLIQPVNSAHVNDEHDWKSKYGIIGLGSELKKLIETIPAQVPAISPAAPSSPPSQIPQF